MNVTNLLVKFALSENASNANNSMGMLVGLFEVGIGWAATQASPEDRFPIIQDLLASNDRVNKDLGLKLCKSWLNTHGGIRMIGAEYQGLRPPIEFWKPKIYGEVFNAWRLVWRHLYSVSRTWVSEQRQEANRLLIEAGFRLIHYSSVSDEIMDTLLELSDDSATDIRSLTHTIIMELRFRTEKMPKGILGRLRKLDKKITGSSFWERFNRYVLNTNWDEDYDYKGNDIKQSNVPPKRISKLASEVAADASLFSKYLPQFVMSDGHRLYEFGLRMSEMLPSSETVDAIIAAQLQAVPAKQTQFIGGFFFGLKQRALEIWEGAIKRLLDDGSSRDIGVDIILRSGVSKNIIQKLIELHAQGLVNVVAFSRLAWQVKEDNIPLEQMEEVLNVLTYSDDNDALKIAIELTDHYFFNKEQPKSCDENLLFRLLTKDKFFDRKFENMIGYHWHVVARGFLDRFPGRDIELFSVIMSHLEDMSSLRSTSYPQQIADEIAKAHPNATWSMISTLLDSDEGVSFYLTSWLGNELEFEEHSQPGAISFFDPQIVMNWVLQDPKKRAWRLIRCLPKTLDEAEGGKLTKLFLEAFGDDEEFSASLISHFWTGGWTGPESAYLSRKRDKARQWLSETRSGKALSWLYRYIASLTEMIKRAELEEERRF